MPLVSTQEKKKFNRIQMIHINTWGRKNLVTEDIYLLGTFHFSPYKFAQFHSKLSAFFSVSKLKMVKYQKRKTIPFLFAPTQIIAWNMSNIQNQTDLSHNKLRSPIKSKQKASVENIKTLGSQEAVSTSATDEVISDILRACWSLNGIATGKLYSIWGFNYHKKPALSPHKSKCWISSFFKK